MHMRANAMCHVTRCCGPQPHERSFQHTIISTVIDPLLKPPTHTEGYERSISGGGAATGAAVGAVGAAAATGAAVGAAAIEVTGGTTAAGTATGTAAGTKRLRGSPGGSGWMRARSAAIHRPNCSSSGTVTSSVSRTVAGSSTPPSPTSVEGGLGSACSSSRERAK
eukprot:4907682-Prymnesium_polylepis.1